MQRSLIYPIGTVDLYFQAASGQDLQFALSVFSVKDVRHTESLHFGVTLWKSAGGLIGGKTRKSRERFTTVAELHRPRVHLHWPRQSKVTLGKLLPSVRVGLVNECRVDWRSAERLEEGANAFLRASWEPVRD